MNKIRLLAKSNFRKNRGTSIGLFLLMLLSATLIGISLLMLLDARPTAGREAERLQAGDGMMRIIGQGAGSVDEQALTELFGDKVEHFSFYHGLGYYNVSLPFGDGNVAPSLMITDSTVFDCDRNRTEIVVSDDGITENYVLLPYQFYTSGGYRIGDTYSFELSGNRHVYTVKGFINTTYFGCNNSGSYQFVLDDASYKKLYERDGEASQALIASFQLKAGVNAAKYKMRLADDALLSNPGADVWVSLLDDVLYSKTFISLILAVCFLVLTSVLLMVLVLTLVNCISNYLKENMKNIGAMKAIGYTSSDLRASLYVLFETLALIAVVAGIILAYLLMPLLSGIVVGQMGVPYTVSFNAVATFVPLVFGLLFVFIVTNLSSANIKKMDPILALRDGVKSHSFRKNYMPLDKSPLGIHINLAGKTFFRNMKQNVITFFVVGLMIFCCVISLLMYENFSRNPQLGLFSIELCGGVFVADVRASDEALDYLSSREDVGNVRKGYNLELNYQDEEMLVTWIFENPSQINNQGACFKGRLPEYENEIAVSGKFARDYNLTVGDEVTFKNGEKSFTYLLTGLIQTANNFGKEALLSIEGAGHLFDYTKEPVQLWFDCEDQEAAQRILDDCAGQFGEYAISSLNFYDTMEGNMTTFRGVATFMLIIVCGISAVVIALVLYFLIKALLYNKRRDYGVYKAIGYTSRSLVLQTALSFMPTIMVSAVVFSVISYYAANPYMSLMMSSFGMMKCSFPIPVAGVVVIGCGMVVFSFLMAVLQAGKIKHIEAYRMLVGE